MNNAKVYIRVYHQALLMMMMMMMMTTVRVVVAAAMMMADDNYILVLFPSKRGYILFQKWIYLKLVHDHPVP